MAREQHYGDDRRTQGRGGRYEDDRYERSRYDDRGGYERGSNGRQDFGRYEGQRGGYAENVGQGGYFGDYQRHSEIGRRGGEIRHERAMRARHDLDEPDDRGRGRSSSYGTDDDRYGRQYRN